MKYFFSCLTVLFVISSIFNPAKGELTGVSGPSSSMGAPPAIITAPKDVLNDGVTNEGMQGFDEAQDVTLPRDIEYDSGWIPAGRTVDSHMIFLHATRNMLEDLPDGELMHFDVTWTFEDEILGVMSDVNGEFEEASTDLLRAGKTIYPDPYYELRGLEPRTDGYTINGKELTVSMLVSQPGDWIRVITGPPQIVEIEAQIEIKPETLNLKSKGIVTVFINLPEPYDVEDIVIDTVECEGVIALSGQVTGNGKLIVKFDREELNPKLATGDPVTLAVTGFLTDGTFFWGTDDITIINPGK